ncbi:hypothetical protein [Arthrobacter bambusae]|uniref:hypothetical protein n=1 Tax=Arthrobacter bambusae TaxID=1338426 RepID=UPI00278785B3|nr:hypothetical protein [Arthrobacter bambusae]MDQ0241210.1 hypothetical protein [Arthrobacter bambusae]
MTAVATLLAGIRETSDGLTDLCPEHLRQGIRHLQRNCDIDCNVHDNESTWDDCNQPDRYDGDRMARALASIPRLIQALEAVAGLHYEDVFRGHLSNGCKTCGHDWPCPTITAVAAALGVTE